MSAPLPTPPPTSSPTRRVPRAVAGIAAVATTLALGTAMLAAPGAAGAVDGTSSATATGARSSTTPLPDQATWETDVIRVMAGAKDYLAERVANAAPGERLAINLDIDNTSLATYYDRGHPVRKVRNLARLADQMGIAVLFNTGRLKRNLRGVDTQLAKVGYDVTQLCTRKLGERLAQGKKRCRKSFVDDGYTLVLNVGNNPTDFRGGDYERAYRLPNYDGQLG